MEDLPAMAQVILEEMNQKHDRRVSGIAASALDILMAFDWPGNARELRNTIERAVILGEDGAPLYASHLPSCIHKTQIPTSPAADTNTVQLPVGITMERAERLLIEHTLEATGQNKTRAAEILGISPKTMHNKLKGYSHAQEEPEA